jgi:hypothetical protein
MEPATIESPSRRGPVIQRSVVVPIDDCGRVEALSALR